MKTEETKPGFSFSESTTARAPLRVWITLIVCIGAGAAAWSTTRLDVSNNTARITILENEQRAAREVLIRIDERTAEIKRRMDSK